nr:MAG TPA: hypothetical protein [Caudoviricetes sp.]
MYNIDMRYIAIEILYRVTMNTKIPIILPSGRRRAFVGDSHFNFYCCRLGDSLCVTPSSRLGSA